MIVRCISASLQIANANKLRNLIIYCLMPALSKKSVLSKVAEQVNAQQLEIEEFCKYWECSSHYPGERGYQADCSRLVSDVLKISENRFREWMSQSTPSERRPCYQASLKSINQLGRISLAISQRNLDPQVVKFIRSRPEFEQLLIVWR